VHPADKDKRPAGPRRGALGRPLAPRASGSAEAMLHVAGTPPLTLTIARPVRVLSAGNHHPLLCEMEDETGPAGLWVVKPCIVLSRATDRGAFGILAELAGAEVCAWAGVLTPRVALTRFPAAPSEDALRIGSSACEPPERDEIVETFRVNRGRLAFCARYLEHAPDLSPVHLLRKAWRKKAVKDSVALLVADIYMRHDDRLEENPNAVWHANRVVAIDHGSAFAGLLRPGVRGEDLAKHTQPHAKNFPKHVAFDAVQRYASPRTWDAVLARLEGVPGHAVEALRSTWPPELDDDDQNGQTQLRLRLARFLGARKP